MLIADTTELLSKVIEGSDAPFIYEKPVHMSTII